MELSVKTNIQAKPEQIWRVISDIENSVHTISGIEKIEILEKPGNGLVGLKWRETRTMFGKEATEVMWITDAKENEFYQTRAESHGSVYISKLLISSDGAHSTLTMQMTGIPQTTGTKVMYALTGWMFKNATKKALEADLMDIRNAVEKTG